MRVLVTGGAGFVGNSLVIRLLKDGHQVTSFDRTKYSGLRADVNEVYGDLNDSYSIDCYVRENEYVFNIGGMLGTQETVDNPIPAVQANIIGALNVFSSVRRHSIPMTQITVGNHWMNNPYSITKSCSERFALMFNKEHHTKISVVRGLNIYGPGQKPFPVKKVVPNFVLSALRGDDLTVYGSGDSKMDMIYVDDAAHVLSATMENRTCFDKVIDMGTGIAPSVNEIAQSIITMTHSQSTLNHVPMRPGEDQLSTVCADPALMETVLGIKASSLKSFNEGIVPTIDYYEKWSSKHYK